MKNIKALLLYVRPIVNDMPGCMLLQFLYVSNLSANRRLTIETRMMHNDGRSRGIEAHKTINS